MKQYLILLLLLSGCTTLSNLEPPSKNTYFVLSEDLITRSEVGIASTPAINGLKKGTYKLAGENKSGYYFLPTDGGHFQFIGDDVKKYDEAVLTSDNYNYKKGWLGGLWYPKSEEKDQPRLFISLQSNYKRAAAVGGGVNVATAQLVDGYIVMGNMMTYDYFNSRTKIKEHETLGELNK